MIQQLERGETPGDQIKGVKYTVYKVRVRNTDVSKGKSGGYRAIYYIRTRDHVIVIMLYSKTEQTDIDPDEIRRLIEEAEQASDKSARTKSRWYPTKSGK